MQNEWITLKIHFGVLKKKIRMEWKCKRIIEMRLFLPLLHLQDCSLQHGLLLQLLYHNIHLTSLFLQILLLALLCSWSHIKTSNSCVKALYISCCLHPFNLLHFPCPLTLLPSAPKPFPLPFYLCFFSYCLSLWNSILTSVPIFYSDPVAHECLAETSLSSNINKMTYFSNKQQVEMKNNPRYLLCVSAISCIFALVYGSEIPEERIFNCYFYWWLTLLYIVLEW